MEADWNHINVCIVSKHSQPCSAWAVGVPRQGRLLELGYFRPPPTQLALILLSQGQVSGLQLPQEQAETFPLVLNVTRDYSPPPLPFIDTNLWWSLASLIWVVSAYVVLGSQNEVLIMSVF